MNVNEQIKQIAERIKYLREAIDVPAQDIAEKAGISEDEYLSYENGEKDIPVSIIYEVSSALGVDPTEIITGEAPRMADYCITRAGKGVKVERFEGYSFESLAFNFIGREKEPMIVTISPSEKHAPLVSHSGQEFNYVVSGRMMIEINGKQLILEEGDSIYFDSQQPHGMKALDGEKVCFLAVIL